MRLLRLLKLSILFLSFTMFIVMAQAQEATSEPEATESVVATIAPEATESVEATPVATPDGQTYVVVAGDNLFRIALRNGLTTNQLAAANGITNPSLVFIGQTLIIPNTTTAPVATVVAPEATPDDANAEATAEATAQPTPSATPTPTTSTTSYIVRAGDTLYRIAINNSTTVAELIRLNNIANANLIFTGQQLNLPSSDDNADASAGSSDNTAASSVVVNDDGIEGLMFERGITVFLENQDIDALVSQVTQLQFTWVRVIADWRIIGADETPDFALLDEGVEKFSAAGVKILLTVTGAPDWARPAATEFVLDLQSDYGPPDDPATYAEFIGTLAQRYQGKVQAYEIWSEPNLRRTWISGDVTGRTDARMSNLRYIDLLSAAYTAIKDVDDSILVVSGGLAPTGLNDRINAIDDRVFLTALLAQGVTNVSDGIGAQPAGFANPPDATCCDQLDGISTHYEDERFYFLETLQAYRTILNDNNATDLPLFVTRFGWGTANGNALATPNMDEEPFLTYTDLNEQATYIPRAFDLGADVGYVGGMFLYNLNGCQAGDSEACYYSLIDSSNMARPVFEALQALNSTAP